MQAMRTMREFETKNGKVLEGAPQGGASEVLMACAHSPDAPFGGGVFASELTALNLLVSHGVAVLSIPLVDIVAPRLWGWGWRDMRRWSVKRKQLLLEAWRRWAGYEDEESDEAQVLEISLSFEKQDGFTKPPPKTLKPSSHWLNSSTPLALRAPTFAA